MAHDDSNPEAPSGALDSRRKTNDVVWAPEGTYNTANQAVFQVADDQSVDTQFGTPVIDGAEDERALQQTSWRPQDAGLTGASSTEGQKSRKPSKYWAVST